MTLELSIIWLISKLQELYSDLNDIVVGCIQKRFIHVIDNEDDEERREKNTRLSRGCIDF